MESEQITRNCFKTKTSMQAIRQDRMFLAVTLDETIVMGLRLPRMSLFVLFLRTVFLSLE
jgi:hypothetical protein